MQELNGLRKEGLLNSPEYFFCRKFECRMSRKACVMRQKTTAMFHGKKIPLNIVWFYDCQDCIQGQRIKKELKNGNDHDEHQ